MTRSNQPSVTTPQVHAATTTNKTEGGRMAFRSFMAGACQITFHDLWGKCLINGREVAFTPTQYQMVSPFFHQRLHTSYTPSSQDAEEEPDSIREHEALVVVAIVSTRTLQARTAIPNRTLLRKYISMTNSKLRHHGLRIVPVDRGNFYLLIAGSALSEEDV